MGVFLPFSFYREPLGQKRIVKNGKRGLVSAG